MTKQEAQTIIDKISPDTIIDDNWKDHLLNDKSLTILTALTIVSDKCWTDLLKKYEGQEITVFQTEKPVLHVGKTIRYGANDNYYIITAQDKNFVYYLSEHGYREMIDLKNIDKFLIL